MDERFNDPTSQRVNESTSQRKRVFIVGASGLVGSNCLRHFTAQGWEVMGSYFSYAQDGLVYYNTLQPNDELNFDIIGWKPDAIVHCGALTHVDYCETHEQESYTQTVESTKNLIKVAQACGARLVYLGTDYVFDTTCLMASKDRMQKMHR
jgi:dTDP-4-dehydrorhamnose reductase